MHVLQFILYGIRTRKSNRTKVFPEVKAMAWNFLTNHGLVLTYIGRHPEWTGLEIAQAIGITERAARAIVAELEGAGYIQREKVGRRNRCHVDTSLPLRHRGERAVTVGELLELLWRDEQEPTGPLRIASQTSTMKPAEPRAELTTRVTASE